MNKPVVEISWPADVPTNAEAAFKKPEFLAKIRAIQIDQTLVIKQVPQKITSWKVRELLLKYLCGCKFVLVWPLTGDPKNFEFVRVPKANKKKHKR